MVHVPPTPATPMSPLDALRRLQLPTDLPIDLSPSQEEDIDLQDGVDLEEGVPFEAGDDSGEEEEHADSLESSGTLRNE